MVFIIGALLILAYCSDLQQSATYQDVVYSMCGKRMQTACAITIILYTFGTCITFFIIIGDQWDKCKNVFCKGLLYYCIETVFISYITIYFLF